MKTIGVLTGGGDCPGLDAAIRAVVRSGIRHDYETLGIRNGWMGLIEGDVEPLTDFSVSGILPKGGTILGTSRTDPLKNTSDFQKLQYNLKKYGIHALVVIGPEKYNELHARMHNLNKMLAWGHARAIENILSAVPCSRAVTDQFGDERFVREALLEHGRTIELEQRTRGEEDPAVAAASILARAEFLRRLAGLGREWGMDLPKGAGPPVEAAAVRFVRTHGPDALGKVAKTHFKTTERVLRESA